MTHRWTLKVHVTPTSMEVGGWRGGELLRAIGAHPFWLDRRHVWAVAPHHAVDLIALAEARGAAVIVTGIPLRVEAEQHSDPQPDPQLTLFGGGDGA